MFHVHRWRLGHVHHLCGKKNEVFVRKFAGYSFRGSSLRIPVRKKKIFLARRRMSVDMTVLRPFAREQPFSVWTEAWWALCSVDPRRVEVIDKPRGGSLKVSNGACDTSQPKQQKSKQQKYLKICEYAAAVDHGQVKVWHFRVKFMKCLWIFIMWWIFVICASLFADVHYHCVSVGMKGRLRLTHFFCFLGAILSVPYSISPKVFWIRAMSTKKSEDNPGIAFVFQRYFLFQSFLTPATIGKAYVTIALYCGQCFRCVANPGVKLSLFHEYDPRRTVKAGD